MSDIPPLEGLIDKKVERILKTFFENKEQLFHINKLSQESGVPLATTFRIINRLVTLNILTSIKINKFKIYKLNRSKRTDLLEKLV